ncbi:MAG: hypothetical protein U0Q11_09875 [Vicinamibacterales bacterium]
MSPGVLGIAAVAVLVIYGAGFMRTKAAADRLTQASGRRHPVDMAEVQQVLDVARFNSADAPAAVARPMNAPDASAATAVAAASSARAVDSAGVGDSGAKRSGGTAVASAPALDTTASAVSTSAPAVVAPVPMNEAPAQPAVPPVDIATAPAAAVPVPADAKATAPVEPPKYNDGTFVGWGYCRHGQIQSTIVIEHGRIVSAEITQCGTRYSCDWIAKLPGQVVSRQSAEVDFVSGASESADAFYYSIEDALKKAK